MSQKTAFIIAATITTFLFVLAGGFLASFAAPAAASQQPVAASVSATSVDVQVLQQREQQYQQLLAEANRRLAQAYAQNTAIPATATAAPQVASQPVYPISPNQAAVIALNAAPGSNLQQIPGLVDLQGTVAYQVMLDNGQVYVDANTGQILFNSTAAPLQTGRGHGDDGGTFGNEGSDGDGN